MSKAKDLDALKQWFQSGEYVQFPLKGVLLRHPHLAKPDTEFDPGGDGKYKVCAIVSDDVAEDMKACGFKIHTFEDGQQYVKISRKPQFGPVELVDAGTGDPVPANTIGNGTVATIECTTKYWKVGGKPSQAIYMNKILIEDLVVYVGSGAGAEEGFDPF